MPYIVQSERDRIDRLIDTLILWLPTSDDGVGTVNYVITRLIDGLYGEGGYAVYNRALGVLDGVAKEFYRRRVAPYEDEAMNRNGEVYL